MRRQAADVATSEPSLSSLVHDVVLDQDCLGAALGMRLARKLAREEISPV